jgi:C4-dicarboxylate-specific signal transduction histidine kinase
MAPTQNRKDLHAFIAWFCVLLLWLLLSWVVADSIVKTRTREFIHAETITLDTQVDRITQDVDFGLDYFRGMPRLVAGEVNVGSALSRFGANAGSPLPVDERKKIWSENSLLKDIDSHLDLLAGALGVDVIWVTNAAGDCIASSNAQKAESFVGTNYADRDYFRMAQQGKLGQQYAMGRKTNIPGLYFSAPIVLKGNFAGVAVIKIDLPKLSHWLGQADAFVSDTQGVVVLARDTAMEMHALPTATVMNTTEAERMN